MKKPLILNILVAALSLLWFFASIKKLTDPDKTRAEMAVQAFPHAISKILSLAVPLAELLIALLLLLKNTLSKALYLSAGLLSIYSIYILLVILNVFDKKPCSCGSLIEELSWPEHLLFNLFFLGLSSVAIGLYQKIRVQHGPSCFNTKQLT